MTRKRSSRAAELHVGLGNLPSLAAEFAEAWHAAEAGRPIRGPRERLLFSDLPTLLKALTARRWSLLGDLRRMGPSSVRALARKQGRDYKTVHTDVRELERYGLVSRDGEGRVFVPWSRVTAEFDLERAA